MVGRGSDGAARRAKPLQIAEIVAHGTIVVGALGQPRGRPETPFRQTGGMHELGAYLLVAALVIVTPGQDTALTVHSTLRGGRRAGLAAASGVAAGQAVWTVAASAGLAALLVASEPVFTALRLVGGAFLVWLGVRALAAALRREAAAALGPSCSRAPGPRPAAAFRRGVLSNLANPKMAVFFTSLLPQFVPAGGGFAAMLAVGLLFCALTACWLGAYAFAVDRAGRVLRRPRVRRVLDALTGAVLVALGVRVAAEPR